MKNEAYLTYSIGSSMNTVGMISARLARAQEAVLEKHRGRLLCLAEVHDRLPGKAGVYFRADDSAMLTDALRDFFEIAGPPGNVFRGSNYRAVNSALRHYGHELSNPVLGILFDCRPVKPSTG